MKITDPGQYITLGGRIRYLAGRVGGDTVFGDKYVYSNLVALRNNLEFLGFAVTRNLYDIILLDIEKKYETLKNDSADTKSLVKLTPSQAVSLKNAILKLEDTMYSEAKTKIIALPVPRRFELEHLLDSPGKILGQGVFERLTDLAQNDLAHACRCIAFECPTAAAFHILRCVEECIRFVYKSYFPRRDELRPWGVLISELKEKVRKPKPDEILLVHLDHIRKRFRNPTDHPEKIYQIEEAEDLVHISVDIINRCIRDSQTEKKYFSDDTI